MSDSQTTIRAARDWGKLAREARAAGYKSARSIAVFIADNTSDKRADTPDGYKIAPGYHDMIETWLMQKELAHG